ncbi:MAG: hypothetical protein AAGK04_00585 [Planctomycetota bacterium]
MRYAAASALIIGSVAHGALAGLTWTSQTRTLEGEAIVFVPDGSGAVELSESPSFISNDLGNFDESFDVALRSADEDFGGGVLIRGSQSSFLGPTGLNFTTDTDNANDAATGRSLGSVRSAVEATFTLDEPQLLEWDISWFAGGRFPRASVLLTGPEFEDPGGGLPDDRYIVFDFEGDGGNFIPESNPSTFADSFVVPAGEYTLLVEFVPEEGSSPDASIGGSLNIQFPNIPAPATTGVLVGLLALRRRR